MRWLFVPPLRPFVLLAAVASLLLNIAMLVPSLYMLQIFDRVFASRSVETLLVLSALALLALAFGYAMDVARSRALATAGDALQRSLAPAVLEQALAPNAGDHRNDGSHRRLDALRDVGRLSAFLGSAGVRALFDAPWLPVYLLVIGLMHPALCLAAAVGALALAVLAVCTERSTRDATSRALRRSREADATAESLVRHADALAGNGMTANAIDGWRARHERLLDERSALDARTARLSAVARVVRQGVQLVVLGLGAWLVIDASASPGIMVAATILLGRALQPVEHLIGGWKQLVDARAAWRRLGESGAFAATESRLTLPAPRGTLDVERVVFAHDRSRPPLIKGLSLSLAAGESLGIVGASGAGKSTLVRLLLGIRRPSSGAVRLDGADIARWDRDALGAHIGYLPQDVSLLPGTVAQNIARFGSIDDARVVEAAKLAQAHDMIVRLPEGYDTQVGERGGALSGGQAQRIALARALYGNPQFIVLDEPESHLDAEGQEALKAALRMLKTRGATVIVVGHRVGLMAQLDKIAVLKDGGLHAFGVAAVVLAKAGMASVHTLPAAVSGARTAAA